MKPFSDHITDLYIKWLKEQRKFMREYKRELKKGDKEDRDMRNVRWGEIIAMSRAMLDLADLKLKAITIEMLNKTSHQRKVEEREKTNRPLWAGSKDFKDWQPKKNKSK